MMNATAADEDPPDRAAARAAVAPVRKRRRWAVLAGVTLQAAVIVGWAMLAALLLSTQFLAQPFVWRSFPLDEIASAWGFLFADRLVVTMSIAVTVTRFAAFPAYRPGQRALLVAVGVIVGSFAGEALASLHRGEGDTIGSPWMLVHVVRWCVISLAVIGMYVLNRRVTEGRVAAHNLSLRTARLERQMVQARLQLLRAQIEPHFLFNTLATIRRLQRAEPDRGDLMLANFLDYLRAAMPDLRSNDATLRQELDLVRAYLGLVAVRLSGRLAWSIEVEPSLEPLPFPSLSLATLVENAVKHGIEPSADGGRIDIRARAVDGTMEASVVDSGAGFSSAGGGSGIGLSNTKARLASLYGPAASLALAEHRPHGVCATIRIPLDAVP